MPRHPRSDAEMFRAAWETFLSDVHVSMPAEVQAYANQRADVLPLVKKPLRVDDGSTVYEELPVIPSVPVIWPQGGGYGLHMPLEKGDVVVLVFSDQSYAEWRQTGQLSEPYDLRRHGIGYPFAFPGLLPDASPFATLANGGLRLGKDGAEEQVVIDGGLIKLGASATDFVALASLVQGELNNIKAALDNATTPSGAVTYAGHAYSPSNVAAAITKAK